jgi:hypothetical protein
VQEHRREDRDPPRGLVGSRAGDVRRSVLTVGGEAGGMSFAQLLLEVV